MIGDTQLSLACNATIQGTFGRTAAGSSTFPASADRAILSPFTVPQDCDLTRVYLRFNSTGTAGTNAKALVYANSGSVPGARLGVSSAAAVPAGGGILEFNLSVLGLIAGQTIWMGGVTDSHFAVWRTTSGGGLSRMEGTTYASPNATWTQSGTGVDSVNVWASYTPAPVGPIVGSTSLSLSPSGTLVNANAGAIAGDATLSITGSGTIHNDTPPITFNFGDETLYTDSMPTSVGRMLGKQYTTTEDGELISITVGFTAASAGTFNVKGLLYSDTADLPVTLLAAGTSTVHTTGGGFFETVVAVPYSLVTGTKYWLFGMTDDSGGLGEHAHNAFGTGTGEEAYMVQPGSYSFASPPTTMPAATDRYDYDVSIYATYSVAAPAGAMVGSAALNLAGTGTLTGVGSRPAAAAIAFTASLVRSASGSLIGTTSISFTPSLVRGATAAMAGTTTVSLAPVLVRAAMGALAGSSSISLVPSGTMAAGGIVGSALLSLTCVGTRGATAVAVGSASLALAPAGAVAAAGALVGSAAVQLVPTATISFAGVGLMVGNASIALTPAAAIGATVDLVGSTSLSLASTAQVRGIAGIAGAASMSFTAQAAGNLLGALDGTALIAVAMVGQLLGRLALSGNAGLSISCSVSAGAGYDRPPIIGNRPDSSLDGPADRPHDLVGPGVRDGGALVVAER